MKEALMSILWEYMPDILVAPFFRETPPSSSQWQWPRIKYTVVS